MLAFDNHDAEALLALVDPQLALGQEPLELIALEYLIVCHKDIYLMH